ncbi:hypothetical protein SAMN05428985_10616 [Nocardioides sp. YR527]|uniref:DUF5829 family protein n=1 Tax=Nocardioides sp. YR527 TaxID=1881028 RepID=UPI0008899605|nr:DUF5829 family protein [Nocardioides sp. YR527]SDK77757.1 hypothetical protein SAMN05428985_10616 [Nocardioides sp. YR527]
MRTPLSGLVAAAIASLAITSGALATPAHAEEEARPDPLLAFNHAWAMVDRETADAIEHSEYLGEFADRRINTGNDGTSTWTGRYLLGKETYLEFFGPGDAPDAVAGDTGLAVSADNDGDLAVATDNLRKLVVDPVEFTQVTDLGDGNPIPWFDVTYTTATYDTFFSWAMEYRDEFLNDPRLTFPPPAYEGDVSRDRYNRDRYLDHQMRDVIGIQIATTAEDIDKMVPLWRAAGITIRTLKDGGILAFDGMTTIRLLPVPAEEAGVRHIILALNEAAEEPHTETIGNSTLHVGPGAYALWTFDPIEPEATARSQGKGKPLHPAFGG